MTRTVTVYVYGGGDWKRRGTHYSISEARAREIVTDPEQRKENLFIVSDDATGKRIESLSDRFTTINIDA